MMVALAVERFDVDVGAMRPVAQSSRPDRPAPRTPDGLEARRAALRMVDAALFRRGGADDLDDAILTGLEPRDRAFARALGLAMLRWRGPVDRALGVKLRKPPPDAVMALLRLGAVQMLALDTPPHAAVSTTLALAEVANATKPFVKLINAILRGLDRERPVITPDQFAPDWLLARWTATYGVETATALATAIAAEPPTDLSLRNPAQANAVAAAMEGVVLPGGSIRAGRRGDVTTWPGFAEGDWWVQDAAAAIPVRALSIQPGQSALDLCAAPGGKTLQLAAGGALVTALDRAAERLHRVTDNLRRVGLQAETIVADAANWRDSRTFDAVLLDAPCSATGTFRRHPDVLWTARPSDIASLAAAQAKLLDAAADRVKPGGRLVYSVCSLEPEEGEAQIAPFLARRPDIALEPIDAIEVGAPLSAQRADGMLRLLPSMDPPSGGLDGFFIARFRRTT